MNEFKGTPGRWIKRGDVIVAPGDIEVAVVVNFQDDEALDADATLIASSPRLLELLIKCADALEEVSSQQWCGPIIDEARAEIAKALGESK